PLEGLRGWRLTATNIGDTSMIPSEVQSALAAQINQEFTAAYTYLAMAAWFDRQSLDGFAAWMQFQHQEENSHGMKLFRYLLDRGGNFELAGIGKPRTEYDSVREVFESALAQERENTRSINSLYELATSANDYATISHLQWFLDEQVEEEKSIEDILALID